MSLSRDAIFRFPIVSRLRKFRIEHLVLNFRRKAEFGGRPMADITAQQLADAIAYAVSEDMEPDEPARVTIRGGLENFTVRGEFELELVATALN